MGALAKAAAPAESSPVPRTGYRCRISVAAAELDDEDRAWLVDAIYGGAWTPAALGRFLRQQGVAAGGHPISDQMIRRHRNQPCQWCTDDGLRPGGDA